MRTACFSSQTPASFSSRASLTLDALAFARFASHCASAAHAFAFVAAVTPWLPSGPLDLLTVPPLHQRLTVLTAAAIAVPIGFPPS